MKDGRPEAISLFTGAGGLDIGLEMAGFSIVAASDHDRDCILSLQANQRAAIAVPGSEGNSFLRGTNIIQAKVEDLTADALRPTGCAPDWTPDLLLGGPPCQPFSSSGRMLSLDDPRGLLFEHFARLASELRPRFILFENVRGLVTASGRNGEAGAALLEIKATFERIGYATRFALMNAADLGSPQRRIRLFMIGGRSSPLPEFPEATHSSRPEATLFGPTAKWVSLRDFLSSRAEPSDDEVIRPTPELESRLRHVPDGSGIKSPGFREATRPGGHWGYKQGTFVADQNKPARTVTTSTQDWIRLSDGSLRRITWREAAALQGFPETWVFVGNTASRLRQIGNAVPAAFGRAIGEGLAAAARLTEGPRPASAPFPSDFAEAVAYTRRERQRNGDSRRRAAAAVRERTAPVRTVKGFGRAEVRSSD